MARASYVTIVKTSENERLAVLGKRSAKDLPDEYAGEVMATIKLSKSVSNIEDAWDEVDAKLNELEEL